MNHHKQRKLAQQSYTKYFLLDAIRLIKCRYRLGYSEVVLGCKYADVFEDLIRALSYIQIYIDIELVPETSDKFKHYRATFTGLIK